MNDKQKVLNALDVADFDAVTVSAIAVRTGLQKSKVEEVLETLQDEGAVTFVGGDKWDLTVMGMMVAKSGWLE